MDAVFVLVHSPSVGPGTWCPVAGELRAGGATVVVPSLAGVGWDAQPCGYLLFGPPYERVANEAAARGWAVERIPGLHLHQLVDPGGVAARIAGMARTWSPPSPPAGARA